LTKMTTLQNNVSCVILNYNDAPTTMTLLEHIKDFSVFKHIVVLDNLSTDNSFEILSLYQNEKIHVVQTERNGGYGYGNNFGIRYSKNVLGADYVLIANPDVVFDQDCVQKLLESFADERVAVVSAKQSNSPDCAWKNCSVMQYVLATSLFFEVWLKIRNYPKRYFQNKDAAEVFAVPGSLLMVDAEKMTRHGMYDEDFFLYYEEPVLGLKIHGSGLKTILRLDTSYIHNHHVSISKTYQRWSQQHRILLKSAELFLRKYKKANVIQIAFAKIWFAYTKIEFWIYDQFCWLKHYSKKS